MKTFTLFLVTVVLLAACSGAPPDTISGDDVVAAFEAAGLEADSPSPMTREDYGAAPYVCQSTHFLVPSLGADSGGRVFVCDNTEDRDALVNYYNELGRSSAAFFSWVFTSGNVVVQINGDLPEDQARQYEAALNSLHGE
jgi:hypothetical protein